jgi:hypothetical protein
MSSDQSSKSRAARALIALAALALAISMSTGSALALPASGEVSLSLKTGAEGSLPRQGVKATYTAKAGKTGATKRVSTSKKGKGGSAVVLPIVDVEMLGAATIRTDGAVVLSAKGHTARLKNLTLQIAGKKTAISAKLGKKTLIFFRAEGEPVIDKASLKLSKAPLSLTEKGAKALAEQLDLDRLSAGKSGSVDVDASFTAAPLAPAADNKQPEQPGSKEIVDPYAQQCALKVKSETPGSAAGPAAAPTLSSPAALNGGKIEWGLSESLRFYVVQISGGALVPIAPAEVLDPPAPPALPVGSFRFPAGSGSYAINTPEDSGDDQAIVNGQGEVVLCNSPHGFRVTLSNPTVTIDGEDSRLTVDIDTNMSGFWTPTQRVDLAALDLDGASPFYNENAKTVTWSGVPVTLTAAGEQALQLCDPHAPGPCDYEEGDSLDPLTVVASTAAEVAWPFGAGCTLGIPATASSWPTAPAAPLALPALTTPESIASGAINWGVRNSLRATVNTNGVFNLAGGATRSDPTDMSGPGKFFTWPSSSGAYETGTPGRLVLHGSGSVGLCNTAHGFGTVLSNPTVVIDAAKSRLVMDVATRLGTSWTSGRVDLADVATGGVVKTTTPDTPGAGQETITWTFPDLGADNAIGGGDDDTDSANSSVKLAAGGTSGLNLLGGSYKTVGTALNKLSV